MTLSFDPETSTVNVPGSESAEWGSQIFDPDTGTYLFEGPRITSAGHIPIFIPPEPGRYRIYVSRMTGESWAYTKGESFILLDVTVPRSGAVATDQLTRITLSKLRRNRTARALALACKLPFQLIPEHHRLMRSLIRRDILARYRGSFGGWFWTVLNPLLLMLTYFFVFGVVLKARFGTDTSKTGWVLMFLAGMLPWLAISEALGRAPVNMLEHRTIIRKLRFPLDILPLNLTLAGLINECFGLGIFLIGLLLIRHTVPTTLLYLPLLVIPQLLFTGGLSWFLAALGVFFRDLAQINGFLLTVWFFLTPICYPETAMPPEARWLLTKNPVYVLVEGYRSILLLHQPPLWGPLWKLWILALVFFVGGYAFFHKSRKSFADII